MQWVRTSIGLAHRQSAALGACCVVAAVNGPTVLCLQPSTLPCLAYAASYATVALTVAFPHPLHTPQLRTPHTAGKEQLEDAGSSVLKTMLDKVEQLRDQVEKPREHAVDADLFCHLTECGLTMVSRGHAARQVCSRASTGAAFFGVRAGFGLLPAFFLFVCL